MDELNAVRAGVAVTCVLMAASILLSIPLESAAWPVQALLTVAGPLVAVAVGVLTVRSNLGRDEDEDGGDW